MKKKMTIEDLARIVQNEFAGVRDQFAGVRDEFVGVRKEIALIRLEMATKEELRELREELLREFNKFSGGWSTKHTSLHQWVEDIDERLSTLEMKGKRK